MAKGHGEISIFHTHAHTETQVISQAQTHKLEYRSTIPDWIHYDQRLFSQGQHSV